MSVSTFWIKIVGAIIIGSGIAVVVSANAKIGVGLAIFSIGNSIYDWRK